MNVKHAIALVVGLGFGLWTGCEVGDSAAGDAGVSQGASGDGDGDMSGDGDGDTSTGPQGDGDGDGDTSGDGDGDTSGDGDGDGDGDAPMETEVPADPLPTACPEGHAGDGCLECEPGYQDDDGDARCMPSCAGGGAVASLECGDSGHCVLDGDGARMCECRPGHVGELCDGCDEGLQDVDMNGSCQPSCAGGGGERPLDCGDHGTCWESPREGERMCVCDPGFTGPRCDDCPAGTQLVGNSCEPTCEGGGGIDPLYCNFGTCQDPSEAAPRWCQCWSGYEGPTCEDCALGFQDNNANGTCKLSCAGGGFIDPRDCNHGSCNDDSGLAICECSAGYRGQDCDQCEVGYRPSNRVGFCELDEPSEVGLKLWLDADVDMSLGLDQNYHAAYWEDRRNAAVKLQSDATNQRPRYVADGMNGRPVLRFDTGDQLSLDGWSGLVDAPRYTIFMVMDPSEQVLSYPLGGDFAGDEARGLYTEVRPDIPSGNGNASYIPALLHKHAAKASNVLITRTMYLFDQDIPRVFVMRWNSAAANPYLHMSGNSSSSITGHDAMHDLLNGDKPFANPMRLRVGRDLDGTAHHMDLAEVLIYDRVLNDTETNKVLRYLHAKWLGGQPQ